MTKQIKDPKASAKNQHHLERVAWLLDGVILLPGGFRVGLDALIGLIPVIGDIFTALLSTYIVGVGVYKGVPKSIILKMIFNVLIDALLGMVPVFGDIFDIVNRANTKNLNLLKEYFDQPQEVTRSSKVWMVSIILLTILLVGLFLWLAILSAKVFLGLVFKI